MPEKTVRVSVPRSRVSLRSLSAPSTCSALVMRATRRSTFLKSSIEMVVLSGCGGVAGVLAVPLPALRAASEGAFVAPGCAPRSAFASRI